MQQAKQFFNDFFGLPCLRIDVAGSSRLQAIFQKEKTLPTEYCMQKLFCLKIGGPDPCTHILSQIGPS